jgi:hypothetical protein
MPTSAEPRARWAKCPRCSYDFALVPHLPPAPDPPTSARAGTPPSVMCICDHHRDMHLEEEEGELGACDANAFCSCMKFVPDQPVAPAEPTLGDTKPCAKCDHPGFEHRSTGWDCIACGETGPCARPAPSPAASADVIERAKPYKAIDGIVSRDHAAKTTDDIVRLARLWAASGANDAFGDGFQWVSVRILADEIERLARALLDAEAKYNALWEMLKDTHLVQAIEARDVAESRLAESEAARARLAEIAAKVPHLITTIDGVMIASYHPTESDKRECARLGGACAFEAAAREGKAKCEGPYCEQCGDCVVCYAEDRCSESSDGKHSEPRR